MMGSVGFRAPKLLPVQLRLEGLSDRLDAAQRAATELMPDLPADVSKDLRIRIEIGARTRSMFGLRHGFAGLARTLCLVLDGSVPDEDVWYPAALRQLQGEGKGRRPILPPDLGAALLKIDVDPSCPDLDLPDTEALDMLKDQLATAIDLLRTFEALARSLDAELECGALFAGRLPDADFTKHHCTRQARATLQHAALGRAWATIKQLCDERGRRIVVFGSFFEGRVHGRSDLDLFLPETGLPEEIRVGLSRDIEALAHDEGIPVDIHFADTNADTFPDQIRVIVDGKIQPLRSLAGG